MALALSMVPAERLLRQNRTAQVIRCVCTVSTHRLRVVHPTRRLPQLPSHRGTLKRVETGRSSQDLPLGFRP